MATLRPLRATDVQDVVALNQRNVEMLAPMDEAHLHRLLAVADRFDVLEVDGRFAGFVMTMRSGAPYESENYAWFSQRYERFSYLDRIVLHEDFRRRGLGGFVYDAAEAAAVRDGRLCLEVNLVPRNDASLAFHAARGYVEVGQLGDEAHLVSMMTKDCQGPISPACP